MLSSSPVIGLFETCIELSYVSATRKYRKEKEQTEEASDVLQSLPEGDRGRYDLQFWATKVYLDTTVLPIVVPQKGSGQGTYLNLCCIVYSQVKKVAR